MLPPRLWSAVSLYTLFTVCTQTVLSETITGGPWVGLPADPLHRRNYDGYATAPTTQNIPATGELPAFAEAANGITPPASATPYDQNQGTNQGFNQGTNQGFNQGTNQGFNQGVLPNNDVSTNAAVTESNRWTRRFGR